MALSTARRRQGQVISISLTPTPTVEVTVAADPSVTVFVPFLDSYTPAVNDYVVLLEADGDYLCLGSATGAASAGVTYTPTWRSTGTQPTVGNGTLQGRYTMLTPKMCYVRTKLTIGSTSAGGTGNYSFDLPFAAAADYTQFIQFRIATAGGATNFLGFGFITVSGTAAAVYACYTNGTAAAALVGNAAPVLNTGSELSMWGQYEIT
jgi:hypothetical protein